MKSILVSEFKKIKSSEDIFLLDVRTRSEFELANIGGTLIPLDELDGRLEEIPKDKNIYCLCHHGVRSMHAAHLLTLLEYENVWNIEGGIHAWSTEVDSNIPQY